MIAYNRKLADTPFAERRCLPDARPSASPFEAGGELIRRMGRHAGSQIVMQTYRELTNVREQIERLEAQLERLDQQVALATVHVRLLGPDVPAHLADPDWSAARITSHAAWALVRGLQLVTTVLIYAVVTGLPLVLIGAVPVLLVMTSVRRRARSGS